MYNIVDAIYQMVVSQLLNSKWKKYLLSSKTESNIKINLISGSTTSIGGWKYSTKTSW